MKPGVGPLGLRPSVKKVRMGRVLSGEILAIQGVYLRIFHLHRHIPP
jgi:hypothetical protein